MRGFLAGLIWGVAAVAVVGAVMSLLSPLPSGPDVVTDAPDAGTQSGDPVAESGVGRAGVDADLVNAAPTVPGDESGAPDTLASMDGTDTSPGARPVVGGDTTLGETESGDMATVATGSPTLPPAPGTTPAAPGRAEGAPDDLGSMQHADTTPSGQPEIGDNTEALSGPEGTGQGAEVVVNSDTPVAPSQPGAAPEAPQGETDLALSSDPAQPVMPSVSDAGSGFGNAPTGESAPVVTSSDEAAPVTSDGSGAVAEPGAGTAPAATPETAQAPDTSLTPAPGAPGEAVTSGVTAPETQSQPAMPATTQQQTTPDASTTPAVSTEPATPPAPRVAALPQAGSDGATLRPSIGTPVIPLTERNAAAVATPVVAAEPPIILYSEPFSNPDNKPIMSIILIDDKDAIGVEALANFPQPLTMAVDPAAPDAAEKMARHRAAGFEVVALIDLPGGATAQDAEVSLAASFAEMPEVVAILEGPGSGIQGNRALADQVSAIVASTGHGIVMQDNGLNTVYKLAVRAGIPAGVVFRDFDGAGQTGTVMRRFLDQAAFRAGQDGAVIMLGRVRPDTISALLLWALQDRAARVALAPVSAVLRDDDAQ